ncbi:MAG: carbohydrate-binding family 9-like protein [Fibrobacteres bacterium]|nr:carbohydrate-binding family 9-like protein [Fibrobacterota bacterium]
MLFLFLLISALSVSYAGDTLRVKHSFAAVSVDGILNEPVWMEAESTDVIKTPWGGGRGSRMKMRILRDDSAIYIGLNVIDTSIVAVCTTGTSIDGDEMIEMHISPDAANPAYFYYLEHNLRQIRRKGIRHSQSSGKNDWNTVWPNSDQITITYKVNGTINDQVRDTGWSEEIRVPFSVFTGWQTTLYAAPAGWKPATPPSDSVVWRFNLCRQNQNYYKDSLSDWTIWNHNGNYPYGVTGVHLHDHNNFGTILFLKDRISAEKRGVKDSEKLELSPNPFRSSLGINFRGEKPVKSVILSPDGKVAGILEFSGNGKNRHAEWKPKNIPAGVYIVLLSFADGRQISVKTLLLR